MPAKAREPIIQGRLWYTGVPHGNSSFMNNHVPAERTATDDRIDENREPAPIAPVTRDPEKSEPGGLPPGQSDSTRSPLDPVL
jgi:hypothetical protein